MLCIKFMIYHSGFFVGHNPEKRRRNLKESPHGRSSIFLFVSLTALNSASVQNKFRLPLFQLHVHAKCINIHFVLAGQIRYVQRCQECRSLVSDWSMFPQHSFLKRVDFAICQCNIYRNFHIMQFQGVSFITTRAARFSFFSVQEEQEKKTGKASDVFNKPQQYFSHRHSLSILQLATHFLHWKFKVTMHTFKRPFWIMCLMALKRKNMFKDGCIKASFCCKTKAC